MGEGVFAQNIIFEALEWTQIPCAGSYLDVAGCGTIRLFPFPLTVPGARHDLQSS